VLMLKSDAIRSLCARVESDSGEYHVSPGGGKWWEGNKRTVY
jgi:hypothetical protein